MQTRLHFSLISCSSYINISYKLVGSKKTVEIKILRHFSSLWKVRILSDNYYTSGSERPKTLPVLSERGKIVKTSAKVPDKSRDTTGRKREQRRCRQQYGRKKQYQQYYREARNSRDCSDRMDTINSSRNKL